MPAYNMQRYIAESVESVINQTYQNWELIIVDDGSTDSTVQIVKAYLKDSRIRYFYQENSGQAIARNYAISESAGDYIAFLDADDLWLPQKLTFSLRLIEENNCDLIFTNCYVFEDGSDAKGMTKTEIGVKSATYQGKTGIITFLEENRVPNLTVLVKKGMLRKAGEFINTKAAEDYDMWLRLLNNGAVFCSNSTCLAAYRMRPDSITAQDRSALFESMLAINRFLKAHPEFRAEIGANHLVKFKYWLYNGYQPENDQYRQLISGVYSPLTNFFLYACSFILPFKYLRKLSNKLI